SGVERQLVTDLSGPEQVAEERPFTVGEADIDPARIELDWGDVVVGPIDAEAAPQFVHRHVWAALDEAPELGRRALAVALGVRVLSGPETGARWVPRRAGYRTVLPLGAIRLWGAIRSRRAACRHHAVHGC